MYLQLPAYEQVGERGSLLPLGFQYYDCHQRQCSDGLRLDSEDGIVFVLS